MGHCHSIISSHKQTSTRMVLPVVQYQPARIIPDFSTRPHRYHGILERRRNEVEKRRSTPPRCRWTARGGKRDKGMGLYSLNGPESHPGGHSHQRNLDSNLTVIHPSTFLECKKHVRPTSRVRPNLSRAQYLLTHFLFPIPPSRTHLGDSRS